MTIEINWQNPSNEDAVQELIPVFSAAWVITRVADVIIDCSWQVLTTPIAHSQSGLTEKLRAYLLNPNQYGLQIKLMRQGSDYAQKVWQQLLQIPFGEVVTYAELAQQIGSGPRAVAQACRNNPYAGLIPCHRVVAKAGLGGFMGQTQGPMLVLKQALLNYEFETAAKFDE